MIDEATQVTRLLPNIKEFYEKVVDVQTRYGFAPTPQPDGDKIEWGAFQQSNDMSRFEYLSSVSKVTRAQRERIDTFMKSL
jgi:hypothetical protein